MPAVIHTKRFRHLYWITGCFAGLLAFFFLFPSRGTGDVGLYQSLIERFHAGGIAALAECVTQTCPPAHLWNYPPLYLVIFYGGQLILGNVFTSFVLHKVLIAMFFFASVFLLVYLGGRVHQHSAFSLPYVLRAVFLAVTGFSIVLNSQGLGYIDIFTLPFILLVVIFLQRNAFFVSGIFFACAFLVKWLPILMFPFLIIYIYRNGKKSLVEFLLGVSSTVMLISTVSWGTHLIPAYINIFSATTQDPYFAAAPTLPWFWTVLFPELTKGFSDNLLLYINTSSATPPILLMYKTFKFAFIVYFVWLISLNVRMRVTRQSLQSLLVFCVYTYLGYFFIASGVHENHLMLGVYCSLILAVISSHHRHAQLYRRMDSISGVSMLLYYGVSGTPFIPISLRTIAYVTTVGLLLIIFFFFQLTNIRQDLDQETL